MGSKRDGTIDRKARNSMHMQILAKLFGFTLKYVPKLFAIFYEKASSYIGFIVHMALRLCSPDVRILKSK